MATISSHNPFRPQPLSPTATGASINPPPSFHTVAGEDETTVNPEHIHDLPAIPEISERDVERDLPPIPERQVERAHARERSVSPVITIDPPEDPPAYTPSPDVHHGESTLELGPRRPFQRAQRTGDGPVRPGPTLGSSLTPTLTGYPSPTPTRYNSNSFPSSRGRDRNRRYNLLQQLTDTLVDQLDHVAVSSGIGNIFTPPAGNNTQTTPHQPPPPRHVRSYSSLSPTTTSTSTFTPIPPPLPSRQSPPQIQTQPGRLSPNFTGSSSSTRINSANTGTTVPTSDFARDFYAVGAAEGMINLNNSESVSDSSSDEGHGRRRQSHENENDEIIAQLLSDDDRPSNQSHTPQTPPQAPHVLQRRRSSSGSYPSSISVRPTMSRSTPSSPTTTRSPRLPLSSPSPPPPAGTGSGLNMEDGARPTTRPVPGRVLLRGGKILIYPIGYTCPKCFNTGYRNKHSNPFHPCKDCWNKHSKAYTTALLYAPGVNVTTSLQRPLPNRTPPLLTSQPSSSRVQDPGTVARLNTPTFPDRLHPSRSFRGQHQYSRYGSSSGMMIPSNRSPSSSSDLFSDAPRLSLSPSPPNIVSLPGSPNGLAGGRAGGPPPGSVVLPAGDPRLGGTRCWRCGGSGRVSYFILDSSQCMECAGIGRVYK